MVVHGSFQMGQELIVLIFGNNHHFISFTCSCATIASYYGQLECLKYAHVNGCEWLEEESICSFAAKNGHLNCLKYAHENGCTWDKSTCNNATRNGHLECLKYTCENGCN